MENTSAIESWLKQATCSLSAASATQVRKEIHEHYESACAEGLNGNVNSDSVDRLAVASLGDPKHANRQYRKVMLTASEARLLRQSKWEARAVCPWIKYLALVPAALVSAGIWLLAAHHLQTGLALLILAFGLGLICASPYLPIYTPERARIFRAVRWTWLAAVLAWSVWPNVLQQSWLLAACGWPIVWIEYQLFSIRRKLPVSEWPKQLYL